MVGRARLADEKGQLLIITALGLVMLLGVTAFSIDASFMYDRRNRLYASADAAAKSGAIEVRRYANPSATVPPLTSLEKFADQQVASHGFTPSRQGGTASVVVNHPPSALSVFNGNPNYVEVIVSETTPTFFGKLLGRLNMNPGARAVAGISGGPNCLVIFDHVSLKISGTSTVDMPNCSMVIGGTSGPTAPATSDLLNEADIDAKGVGVVHTGFTGCDTGGNCFLRSGQPVTYGVAPPTDPLGTLPALADPAPFVCGAPFVISANITISVTDYDKYYCGFEFDGGTLTLNAGNYYVNGPMTARTPGTDVVINSTDAMIFLSAALGRVDLESNHVELNMTAATSGTYEGILFYQHRGTPVATIAEFGKNLTILAVRGAFYFPTANIVMKNEVSSGTMTNPCTLIVAWAVEVDVAAFVLDNACTIFGGSPILTVSIAE